MMNDECEMVNDESRASSNSSFIIPHSSLPVHAVEVYRAAENLLGLAAAELREVVDALFLGEFRAVVEPAGHGRAVQKARADGDVARLLALCPRRHEDRGLLHAVEPQQLPAQQRAARARLAALAQV